MTASTAPPPATPFFPPLCPDNYPPISSSSVATIGREACRLNDDRPPPTDRPNITLKYAQSLDGRIAASSGDSRWISGPESRTLAHRLRAEHDAVLVGVGTVIVDDPLLTVRLVEGPDPLRVVLDTHLRTPLTSRLLTDSPERTVIAAGKGVSARRASAVRELGARVIELPTVDYRVDLEALLRHLAEAGVASLLVEGGAEVSTAMLRLRRVDQIVIFIAPLILGAGIEAIGDLGISVIDDAVAMREHSIERAGTDIVFRAQPHWPEEARRNA